MVVRGGDVAMDLARIRWRCEGVELETKKEGRKERKSKLELTFFVLPPSFLPAFSSTGKEFPIMYDKILNDYKNYYFNAKIKSVLKFRGPEARAEFIEKAEAFRVSSTLLLLLSLSLSYSFDLSNPRAHAFLLSPFIFDDNRNCCDPSLPSTEA